jgi:hypothetical protein
MTNLTRYRYEKRIQAIEKKNDELTEALCEYRIACSEIYNACTELIDKNFSSISIGFVLNQFKRVWIKIP